MSRSIGSAAARALVACTCACLLAAASLPAVADRATRNVLVLYSNSRLLPVNVAGDSGLREAIHESADRPVVVFDEFLDFPRFSGQAHWQTIATYLRDKYASRPPDVIVAGGQAALDFLLSKRVELFPGVPVVHFGVTRRYLASIAPLPPDAIGVPFELDFVRTIEQALRWHQKARHVVLVTGAALQDREWETELRSGLPGWNGRITLEFLAGLPTDAVLRRVRQRVCTLPSRPSHPASARCSTVSWPAGSTGKSHTNWALRSVQSRRAAPRSW